MNPISIKAVDIQDAWFQALVHILESGREYVIDCGSFCGQTRLELDYVTIQITHPSTHPLLPVIPLHYGIPNPVDANYLIQYMPYLMTDAVAENEEYTYGQYLEPQIAKVIKMFRDKGHGTNQAYMAIGDMNMIDSPDPACLRGIDCRVQDGQLHFMLYFRCIDSETKTLFKVNDEIICGTLREAHEKFQAGESVYLISNNNGSPTWGKVTNSVMRKVSPSEVKTYKLRGNDNLNITDDHWMFVYEKTKTELRPAKELIKGDKLTRFPFTHSLDRKIIPFVDLFELFNDADGYYIRNITLDDVKSLTLNSKSSWRDKRVVPLSCVTDINKIPSRAVIGRINSALSHNRYLKLTYNLGYVFGAWLANGWFKPSATLIAIGTYRVEQLKKLNESLVEAGIHFTRYPQDSVDIFHIGDKLFSDMMSLLGFKMGAHIKDVPNFIFSSPKEFISGIYEGWIDGDSGCTVSKALAIGMRLAASIVGIPTSLYIEPSRTVCFAMENRYIKSSVSYRVASNENIRHKISDTISYSTIKEIEDATDTTHAVDFTIQDFSNFCIGSGNIIVHNSWCAWAGLPANLAAIQLMKEYMAAEIGVSDGQIIAASKGLHLYQYAVKLAKIRTGKE